MPKEYQREEERLTAVCNAMREMVNTTVREGMLHVMPDPVEARQLSDVHLRLLQRIRAMEFTLVEFRSDLQRLHEVFDRADRRAHAPTYVVEEEPSHLYLESTDAK